MRARAAHAPAVAAAAFARSPPRLRVSLGRVVLVHWADQLGGRCGAGFRAIRGARKSCVLMRDDANSCTYARSCDPAPPALKNEWFLCIHALGAPDRPAWAARRSAGRFFYAVLCALAMQSRHFFACGSHRQRNCERVTWRWSIVRRSAQTGAR